MRAARIIRNFPIIFAPALIGLLAIGARPTCAQGSPRYHRNQTRAPRQKHAAERGRFVTDISADWLAAVDSSRSALHDVWYREVPANAKSLLASDIERAAASGDLWIWRTFPVPSVMEHRSLRLMLSSKAAETTVWLNGVEVAMDGMQAPGAGFDISRLVVAGQPAILAVRYAGSSTAPVSLALVAARNMVTSAALWEADEAYLQALTVKLIGGGWITVHVDLQNNSAITADADLDVLVHTAGQTKHRMAEAAQTIRISPGRNVADVLLKCGSPKPDAQGLISSVVADVTLRQGADMLDNGSIQVP